MLKVKFHVKVTLTSSSLFQNSRENYVKMQFKKIAFSLDYKTKIFADSSLCGEGGEYRKLEL